MSEEVPREGGRNEGKREEGGREMDFLIYLHRNGTVKTTNMVLLLVYLRGRRRSGLIG